MYVLADRESYVSKTVGVNVDSLDVCIYKNMRTRSLDLPPLWSYLKNIVYFGAFKIFWMHQM